MPLGSCRLSAVVRCCCFLLLFARNSSAGIADPVSLLLLYAFTLAG